MGKGRNLVEYYTNDDPTDAYGFRSTRYAIIGDDGKLIQDNVDPNTIAKTENGQYVPGTTYFMTERLGQDAGALAGTYINGTSIDEKPSNTFFYKNPTTGTQRYTHDVTLPKCRIMSLPFHSLGISNHRR